MSSNHVPARARIAVAMVAIAVAGAAVAQQGSALPQPTRRPGLNLPENPQLFGTAMPSVVKATAIVNGEVITQTDIDQRLALLIAAQGGRIPAAELEQVRQQVLRNLIDETLQIQAARAEEIVVKPAEIDRTLENVAKSNKQTLQQFTSLIEASGSSMRALRRQIEGEIAWAKLQQKKIEVTVGGEEVKAKLDKLNASKGTQEYRVGEIFLSATAANQSQVYQNAQRILEQLKNGASFTGYARQYSEASTAAVGGDLGWVRPEQLPEPLAVVLRQMNPGQISNPIAVPGGLSILAVQDTRKILTADPRNAVLSLKQVSIKFPPGTTRQSAEPIVARFAEAARNVGGCGGADRIASTFNGELIQSDATPLRELPPVLQQLMLPMQVGQATQPFGTIEEGIRILVICGRDEIDPTLPTYDDVYAQLNEERVNLRSRRYLRDLRRDAVIEFR